MKGRILIILTVIASALILFSLSGVSNNSGVGLSPKGGSLCTSIKSGGNLDSSVNIVFVPSGYGGNMLKFEDDARRLWKDFENHDIFLIDRLNVFASKREKGFGLKSYCNFGPFGSAPQFLLCDPIKARSSSGECYDGKRETIVIHNSETFGGAGLFWPVNLHVATVSLHPKASKVAIHELAHVLFGFGDEYSSSNNFYSTPSSSPNCDLQGCPKWNDLVGEFNDVSCIYGFCTEGKYSIAKKNSIMTNQNNLEFGSANERIACCVYKERTGKYPNNLCAKFQNKRDITPLDEFCGGPGVKSSLISDSGLKSLRSDQQFWEYPLNDGRFSTKII